MTRQELTRTATLESLKLVSLCASAESQTRHARSLLGTYMLRVLCIFTPDRLGLALVQTRRDLLMVMR